MYTASQKHERIFESRPFMYNKTFYASFGTFCVQIGHFLEAQWVFEKCLQTVKSPFSKENVFDFGILTKGYSLTVPWIIAQFGRTMCQKKREDVSYHLFLEIFQKYFVVHERSAVKNSFIKICLLCLPVYSKVHLLFLPRKFFLTKRDLKIPKESRFRW